MNEWCFWGYMMLLAGSGVWLTVNLVAGWMQQRRRPRQQLLLQRSAGELVQGLLEESPRPLSVEHTVHAQLLLAELVASVHASLYGCAPAPLTRKLEQRGVDRWLVRQVKRSRGLKRAWALKLWGDLPPMPRVEPACEEWLFDPSPEVRLSALLVRLSAYPQDALRLVASCDKPMTLCEVSEVLHLLRRRLLPIAYQPLLESRNRNLQRLGLLIVHEFSIEEADEGLLRLIASTEDAELSMAALYTLCALHRPLRGKAIRQCIERLTAAERGVLMRHMAREGYAPAQVKRLWSERQRVRYEALVETYKTTLVWS